jgi:transcriptional regulator with XRE-family HTH domain
MASLSLGRDCNYGDCHMAKSHTVDIHVGARLRQRRSLLGMSQTKVGEAVGLTFQQIQKYERGSNRVGSSRLFEFAKVLDVPVSYFFDEMPANALSGRPMAGRGRKGFGETGSPFEQEKDPLIKRETLELVRAYYKIREDRVRKRIFEMVKAVGAASHAEMMGGRKKR